MSFLPGTNALSELRNGRRDPAAAEALDAWLREVCTSFGDRILGVSVEVADTWGRINVPNKMPAIDRLMAATALVHGLTLVTRNVADVAASGVRVVNPFDH